MSRNLDSMLCHLWIYIFHFLVCAHCKKNESNYSLLLLMSCCHLFQFYFFIIGSSYQKNGRQLFWSYKAFLWFHGFDWNSFHFWIEGCVTQIRILTISYIFFHTEMKCKVHIFWEGHKLLRNLHQLFVLCIASQIIWGDVAKFCGLLRKYEL